MVIRHLSSPTTVRFGSAKQWAFLVLKYRAGYPLKAAAVAEILRVPGTPEHPAVFAHFDQTEAMGKHT
jgi:hypothetical protein